MPQARKQTTRRSTEQEKYRAELTSSQLVIGICILMLFGLACFLVGVLVGKFDAAPAVQQTAQVEPEVPARTVRLAPPEPQPEPSPPATQSEPEPAPAAPTENVAAAPPPATTPDPPAPDEPRVIRLPETSPPSPAVEPDAPADESPAQQETPAETEEPEPAPSPDREETEADASADAAEQPETAAAETEVDALEPELEPVAASTSPEAGPAPTEAPSPAADRASGQYTVQIGAFSQQANAEAARKKIEAATAYPVFLVDSPSGTLIKVHVGVFETRDAAENAKRELGERLGYTESIITKHSIALTQAPSN